MLDSISVYAWILTVGFAIYATLGMTWFGVWILYAQRLRRLGYVVVDRHMVVAQLKKDLHLVHGDGNERDDRVAASR